MEPNKPVNIEGGGNPSIPGLPPDVHSESKSNIDPRVEAAAASMTPDNTDRSISSADRVANKRLKDMHIPGFLRQISKAIYRRTTQLNTASRLSNLKGHCMVVRGRQDKMDTISNQLIQNSQIASRFTELEVDVGHSHDEWGQRLYDILRLDDRPRPEDNGELWYGASQDENAVQCGQRQALDSWLREPRRSIVNDQDQDAA